MIWIPLLISAATSIYSGIQQKQKADAQRRLQEAELRHGDELTKELRDRYEKMYAPIEKDLLAQATSDAPTRAAVAEQNQLLAGLQRARQNVNQLNAPTGLQNTLQTGLDLQQAKGLSALASADQERKRAMQQALLNRGNQTPEWMRLSQESSNKKLGYYGQLADLYRNEANQGFASAAQSLGALGSYYGQQAQQPNPMDGRVGMVLQRMPETALPSDGAAPVAPDINTWQYPTSLAGLGSNQWQTGIVPNYQQMAFGR